MSGDNVYDCGGDPVPSPAGDRLDCHGELVGGGLPVQAHGLPQVSDVLILPHHHDQGLLQDIRLLRFGIHPHRHLLGQVSPPCHLPSSIHHVIKLQ